MLYEIAFPATANASIVPTTPSSCTEHQTTDSYGPGSTWVIVPVPGSLDGQDATPLASVATSVAAPPSGNREKVSPTPGVVQFVSRSPNTALSASKSSGQM